MDYTLGMSSSYQNLSHFPDWQDLSESVDAGLSEPWQFWVSHTGSLTEQIITSSGDSALSVAVLDESKGSPLPHEFAQMAEDSVFIREVELQLSGEAVVFARSLIPAALEPMVAGLNAKPLGHILFSRSGHQAQTLKRQYAVIPDADNNTVARRSVYRYEGSNILISEFFLPNFLQRMTV